MLPPGERREGSGRAFPVGVVQEGRCPSWPPEASLSPPYPLYEAPARKASAFFGIRWL